MDQHLRQFMNDRLNKSLGALAFGLLSSLAWSGCGSNVSPDQRTNAETQQIEKLRLENQDLPLVRKQNEEVQRLRKENEELPKLRSQYQEAARLRKENEQLRSRLAKLPTPGAAGPAMAATNSIDTASEKDKRIDELALNEGDEVMVDPKALKLLLPDIDWEKLGRTEPLGIRALLEKNGMQLTNATQLYDYGITNFIIRRAVVPPQSQSPEGGPANAPTK
jgi:TolA-binding protein